MSVRFVKTSVVKTSVMLAVITIIQTTVVGCSITPTAPALE